VPGDPGVGNFEGVRSEVCELAGRFDNLFPKLTFCAAQGSS
jgi:hypothetical protein